MQFLTHTHIDFMKYRKVFVVLSVVLLGAACAELFFMTGLNLGIDFAGGTQLTVQLRDEMQDEQLRRIFEDAGMREAQIQSYGEAEERQVLIKAPVVAGSEEGSAEALIDALDGDLNTGAGGKLDLNRRDSDAVASLLLAADPDGRRTEGDSAAETHYGTVATAVLDQRRDAAIFATWEQVQGAAGLSEAALGVLREQTHLGAFNVLQNDNVGPQIGSELRKKGILAISLSFLGMLMYIWYRFELRFGIGALVAVVHDFLITLGLYAMLDYEFNLPTIAAFLTLVGYSVNDTVVIFDRVRENMRRHRRRSLLEVINESLNQTLSRTVLTSGTTLLVVGCLFVFGGEVIRGFAFVLLVGVLVGTYSSIFVASPFTLLWEQIFGEGAKQRRA